MQSRPLIRVSCETAHGFPRDTGGQPGGRVHENSCRPKGLLETIWRGSQFPGNRKPATLFVARLFSTATNTAIRQLNQSVAAPYRRPRAKVASKEVIFC